MRRFLSLASLFLVAAMLLGCSGQAATPPSVPVSTMAPEATAIPSPTVATMLSPEEEQAKWTAEIEEAFNAPFKNAEVKCGDADPITPGVIVIHMYSEDENLELIEFVIPEANRLEGYARFFAVSPEPDVWISVWSKGVELTLGRIQDLRQEPFMSVVSLGLTAPYVEEGTTLTHFRSYAQVDPGGVIVYVCEGKNK